MSWLHRLPLLALLFALGVPGGATSTAAPSPATALKDYYFKLYPSADFGVTWKMEHLLKGPCGPCGTDSPCRFAVARGYRYDFDAIGGQATQLRLRPALAGPGVRVKIRYGKVGPTEFAALEVHPADATPRRWLKLSSSTHRWASQGLSKRNDCPPDEVAEIEKEADRIRDAVKTTGCSTIDKPKESAGIVLAPSDSGGFELIVTLDPLRKPPAFPNCSYPFSGDPGIPLAVDLPVTRRQITTAPDFTVEDTTVIEKQHCPWQKCLATAKTEWSLAFARYTPKRPW